MKKFWLPCLLFCVVVLLTLGLTSCSDAETAGNDAGDPRRTEARTSCLDAETAGAATLYEPVVLKTPSLDDEVSDCEIQCYFMETADFIRRVENSDWALPDGVEKYYSLTSGVPSICFTYWKDGSRIEEFGEEGEFWLGMTSRLPVRKSLIRLLGNPDILSECLAAQDVDGHVQEVILVYSGLFPFTVVLKTDRETFYLTIDEKEVLSQSCDYVYRLYKAEEYTYNFLKRRVRLIVNGRELDAAGKMLNSTVMLPLADVLAACNVGTVMTEDRMIIGRDKKYCLEFDSFTLTEENGSNDLIPVMPGNFRYWEYTDYGILVDSTSLSQLLHVIGMDATITLDEGKMVVTIQCG